MVLDLVQRLLGPSPKPKRGPEPESDLGSGPRGRLAAKIAKVHARLAAAQDETEQTPPDAAGSGS